MGTKSRIALLPLGCALVLLGALNHAILHINIPHFAVILGVVAVILIAAGGWASMRELRGTPTTAPAIAASPLSPAPSESAPAADAPSPAPVAAGPDDPTIQQ